MPRVPTALLRKARALDFFLPALLSPCRDLGTAQNELRWLREHVDKVAKARQARGQTLAKTSFLAHLVTQRAGGKPLQFLLGTEFFGDLELRVREGVLIPRYVRIVHLRRRMVSGRKLIDHTDRRQQHRYLILCACSATRREPLTELASLTTFAF